MHGKKSVVVTAKLFFATVKRLAGNERANEGISRIQPKWISVTTLAIPAIFYSRERHYL